MLAPTELTLPPHSADAEQAVIGGLLIDPAAWPKIANTISEADFYRDDHRRIYRAIADDLDDQGHTDVVIAADRLERSGQSEQTGGLAYLAEIAAAALPTQTLSAARIVRRYSDQRRLATIGRELAAAAHSKEPAEALAEIEARLAETKKQIGPREQRFKLMTAAEVTAAPSEPVLVEGVMPRSGVAAIIGASAAGKGHLAIDLMACAEEGGTWFGRAVERVPVTYFCLEGAGGLSKRFRAWEISHGRSYPGIAISIDPLDLRDSNQVAALIATIRGAGRSDGIVVIDTLAQATPGMDENSSSDMGTVIAALQRLQAEIGGLILAIHHLGKDSARGPRGHSSFLAALDACIEVRRDGDRRIWSVAKAKDDADGIEHEFKLKVIDLDDGAGKTSCVIEPTTAAVAAVRRALPPKSGNQAVIWTALGELFRKAGDIRPDEAPDTLPAGRPCISLDDAIKETRTRLICDPKRQTERTQSAITGLIARGLLECRGGFLWCK